MFFCMAAPACLRLYLSASIRFVKHAIITTALKERLGITKRKKHPLWRSEAFKDLIQDADSRCCDTESSSKRLKKKRVDAESRFPPLPQQTPSLGWYIQRHQSFDFLSNITFESTCPVHMHVAVARGSSATCINHLTEEINQLPHPLVEFYVYNTCFEVIVYGCCWASMNGAMSARTFSRGSPCRR